VREGRAIVISVSCLRGPRTSPGPAIGLRDGCGKD
jgi:hypothetical protein